MWPKSFNKDDRSLHCYGGCKLESLPKKENTNVPDVVWRITNNIEKHLDEESLYRKSGNKERVAKLQKTNPGRIDVDGVDIHDLTSWLKTFLVDLKAPLIPKTVFEEFHKHYHDPKQKLEILGNILETSDMDLTHRATLKHIMHHLLKVIDKATTNKMTKLNVCVVWAPVLYYPLMTQEEADRCIDFCGILIDLYAKRVKSIANNNVQNIPTKSIYQADPATVPLKFTQSNFDPNRHNTESLDCGDADDREVRRQIKGEPATDFTLGERKKLDIKQRFQKYVRVFVHKENLTVSEEEGVPRCGQ